jgi:hypothetical protein
MFSCGDLIRYCLDAKEVYSGNLNVNMVLTTSKNDTGRKEATKCLQRAICKRDLEQTARPTSSCQMRLQTIDNIPVANAPEVTSGARPNLKKGSSPSDPFLPSVDFSLDFTRNGS